jgi:hypothetical protein
VARFGIGIPEWLEEAWRHRAPRPQAREREAHAWREGQSARFRAVFQGSDYDDWDVTPDGQRLLVKVPASPDEHSGIHVMLEWPSLLK